MDPAEFAAGLTLVLVLAGVALFFAWHQFRTLRLLPERRDLTPDERTHLRRQSSRRLLCCLLMLVFAGFLIGSYFLEGQLEEVREQVRTQHVEQPNAPIGAEQRAFLSRYTWYWIAALLVLLAFLLLAALDVWAVIRHGVHQHRRLREEHHALLEMHMQRMRQEQNGQHE